MTEKDIIHKLTYLLHGHRRKIFIIFGCLLISTGLNLCIPFISKEIMDEGFIGGNKNILLYLVVGSFAIYMLISALKGVVRAAAEPEKILFLKPGPPF